jgi:hypothetical protein
MIFPPYGLKEPNNGNLAYGRWPDLPKRAYELLNIHGRFLLPATPMTLEA